MILNCRTDEEYVEALAMMRVINELRRDSQLHRPIIDDTPWVRTLWARSKYL